MSKENFKTWTRTITGPITEDGTAFEFDARVNQAYDELRNTCDSMGWVPANVTQSFSTQTNGTDVLCVMVVSAQLVSREYAESQQRAMMIQQNGFRR